MNCCGVIRKQFFKDRMGAFNLFMIIISVIILNPVSGCGKESSDLKETYDYFLERLINSSDFCDNVVLRDKFIELPIEKRIPGAGIAAPDEYDIDGLAGDLTISRGGRFMAVSKDRTELYVSRTRRMMNALPSEDFGPYSLADDFKNCYRVKSGQLIPGLPGYLLHSIKEDVVVLQLSNLYDNTDLIESLLDMFETTKDSKYLELAQKILDKLATYYISDIGTVSANWMHFELKHRQSKGMPQSILMHVLYRFLQVKVDAKLETALRLLSSTFVHTWENTNNHFTNSIMGIEITKKVLGIDPFIPNISVLFMKQLLHNIDEQGGRVPHLLKGSPNYPMFKDSYQTYNFMIIGRTIHYYTSLNEEVVMPVCRKMLDISEKILFNGRPKPSDIRDASLIIKGLRFYSQTYSIDVSGQIKKYNRLLSEIPKEVKYIAPEKVYLLNFLSNLLMINREQVLKKDPDLQ